MTLRRLSGLRAVVRCLVLFLALSVPAHAAITISGANSARQVAQRPGEIVVRFRANAHASDRAALHARIGGSVLRDFGFIHAEHLRIQGVTVEQAIERLKGNPLVEYAEPNYEVRALRTPNDPMFSQMYALQNTGQSGGTPGADIDATLAWDLFQGDSSIKVGVIDTGVDYNHPDLAANVWTNPGEVPGNGLDDDGNGYVDDVHGYDFAYGDSDPYDDNGHGTHVSGTIAAVGNNGLGVVGVNWHARIVAIKFLDAYGYGSTAGAIAAVGYAIAAGVRLTNNSWGGGGYSQGLRDAIEAAGAAGQLFVAAAGNSSSDNDVSPQYPASYDSPYIIAVASTDRFDQLSYFSSYGATSVDLAAPGSDILSTLPGGNYGVYSGTSMATPHVTGAAAFALGRFPGMTALQAKTAILASVDPLPSLAGRVATGGRLNLFGVVREPDDVAPGSIADLVADVPGSNTMGLTWTATGDDGASGRASRYEIRYSTAPITEASFPSLPLAPSPDPQPAGSAEHAEVGGLAVNTTYHFAVKAFDDFGNAGPMSNVATGATLGIPDVTLTPASFSEELLTGAVANPILTVRNDGEGTLDFTVPAAELVFAQPIQESLSLEKGAADPRRGTPVVQNQGGPDGYGYRWVDSDQAGGPVFQWVDITGVGSLVPLSGDDDVSGPIAMGMSFPFYGNTFNQIYVSTNGFITFTNQGAPYTNQPLPTTGAPLNLIAPFWDDLYLTGYGIYTHFDGTRFIVSWVLVDHYGGGGPYTFQALFYPSGEIRYQYLSMGVPQDQATIGIQNGTGQIGLTTAFNANYVHDHLAVRFSRIPNWLTVSPLTGRVRAGEPLPLTLHLNALGLSGGDYRANVHLLSNDPDESDVTVPVGLHVIGAPDLAFAPAIVDFGAVFTSTSTTRTLTVSNPGTDLLVISGITSSAPEVTAAPAALSLTPGMQVAVQVTWTPSSSGALNGALTILSNDPDAPERTVPLAGSAAPPPEVSVTPSSLSATLTIPQTTTETLTLHNGGGSPMTWEIVTMGAAQTGGGSFPGPKPTEWTADPRRQAPNTPAFPPVSAPLVVLPVAIQDPAGDGGQVDLVRVRGSGSGGVLQVLMEMTTPFSPYDFGGVLSLDTDQNRQTGYPPSYGLPSQDIGAEYEVWLFSLSSGTVQVYTTYGVYVGSFPVTIGSQSLSFNIPLVYLGNDDGSMNVTGVIGTGYGPTDWFPDVGHGTILGINWLSVSPETGVVPPNSSAPVTVTFVTEALLGGEYHAQLALQTNDPNQPEVSVPVTLTAIGVPDIAVSPGNLDFGTLFLGLSRELGVRIVNEGSDDLVITSGEVSGIGFQLVGGAFPLTLAPDDSTLLTVRFRPQALCSPCTGTMTLHSNDPDEEPSVVPLTGSGVPAPDIALSPSGYEVSLLTGQQATRSLHIENQGGSPLEWSAEPRGVHGTSLTSAPTTWEEHGPVAAGATNLSHHASPPRAVRASYGTATDPAILLYSDDFYSAGDQIADRALRSLGLSYTAYYFDPAGFGNALASRNWDFVIVTHAAYYEVGNYWNAIEAQYNRGAEVLISTFDMDGSNSAPTSLWTTLGMGPRGDFQNAAPVYWWDAGHALFNFPETVPPFTAMGDFYYDNGDRIGVAAASDPAGFVVQRTPDWCGIAVAPTRRAIVNGFIPAENAYDLDSDGKLDAVELLTNEIRFLESGADWLSAEPSSGTIAPGAAADIQVRFDATDLLGDDYRAELVLQSNDPDEPESPVPVLLHVTGVPNLTVEHTTIQIASSAEYYSSGAQTGHVLAIPTPPSSGGVFDLIAEGDYGLSTETAELRVEGLTLGRIGGVGTDCMAVTGEFPVDAATLATLVADGVVYAQVQNSAEVDAFCSPNRHTVRLRYSLGADAIDFGQVFIGQCGRDSIRLVNTGTQVLHVASIAASAPAFSATPGQVDVPAHQSRWVQIAYCPSGPGTDAATLTIQSNDPDTPEIAIALSGRALRPQDIEVSPDHVVSTLPIPGTETRALTIRNLGDVDLHFQVVGTEDSTTAQHAGLEFDRETDDPRPGFLGHGGPDLYGYRWRDSDEPGGPAFSWVDISGVGQLLPIRGDDVMSSPVSMGMNFPFYGNTYGTVRICTNGFLSFTSFNPLYSNQPLPSTAAPANLVAPFWDDLQLSFPSIYTYFDGTRFIVTWVGVSHHRGGGPYTFQALLYRSGEIRYQYLSMGSRTNEATIGIQDETRLIGLTTAFNTGYVHNGLAVRYVYAPRFVVARPDTGRALPGGSATVNLDFNTAALHPGIYREDLHIESDDPDEPVTILPIVVNAGVVADITADPLAVEFGEVMAGQSADRQVTIGNLGPGVLELRSAGVTGTAFALPDAVPPQAIEAGHSVQVRVRFSPATECSPCTGALSIRSDDPDEDPLVVPLSGTGLPPPDIDVDLVALRAAGAGSIGPDALRRTKSLLVRNTGTGPLTFSVALIAAPAPAVAAVPILSDGTRAASPALGSFAAAGASRPTIPAASATWLGVDPTSGAIAPGSSLTLAVTFDATGLPDGDHTASLVISSNDPDEAAVTLPCTFHVGVLGAALDVVPNSLFASAQGRWVSTRIELPQGFDVHAVNGTSVRLQRAVPVDPAAPVAFEDADLDGLLEILEKFDRATVRSYLAEGESAPVELIGEIPDVTWFQGFDAVRSLSPAVHNPPPDAWQYVMGVHVPLQWTDPAGHEANRFDLWQSLDGGVSWEPVALGLTNDAFSWTVPSRSTEHGLLELVAFDQAGAMGSWLSRQFRILPGTADVDEARPREFGLRMAGSNPARGSADFELALPHAAPVEARLHDVHGRLVAELAHGVLDPGWHRLRWDGRDPNGAPAPAGIYFVSAVAGGRTFQVRVVLLR